jgi:hypothetical protein
VRTQPNAGLTSGSRDKILAIALIAITIVLGLAATRILDPGAERPSLFWLSNLVGPVTESMLHGQGMTSCTTAMGTPGNPICFHAGRMPMASLVVLLGYELLGNSVHSVTILKTLLFLLPIQACIWLVCIRLPAAPFRRWLTLLLLVAPFGISAFLADVVNLQVEEGYSYSLLAVAFAMILWKPGGSAASGWLRPIAFALALDGVYLSKSSMALAVALLALCYLVQEKRWPARVAVFFILLAAPVGWALVQHHNSGRYSLGTSLDGINLHKANNPTFLAHYPPTHGSDLDEFDDRLNAGLHFDDEWTFNDYHTRTAVEYIKTHPRETLEGDLRKLGVAFLALHKVGSSESIGIMLVLETAGFFLFRLIQWAAILASLFYIVHSGNGGNKRAAAWSFLALLVGVVTPYLLGFVYTRHVSVLLYPAVLLCCRYLEGPGLLER